MPGSSDDGEWKVYRRKGKTRPVLANKRVSTHARLTPQKTMTAIEKISSSLSSEISAFAVQAVEQLSTLRERILFKGEVRQREKDSMFITSQRRFALLGLGSPATHKTSRIQLLTADALVRALKLVPEHQPESNVKIEVDAKGEVTTFMSIDPNHHTEDNEVMNSEFITKQHYQWSLRRDEIDFVPESSSVSEEIYELVIGQLTKILFSELPIDAKDDTTAAGDEVPDEDADIDEKLDQDIELIIYAPHCPKVLYKCLDVAFKASPSHYRSIAILGNTLSNGDDDDDEMIRAHNDAPILSNREHKNPLFLALSSTSWKMRIKNTHK